MSRKDLAVPVDLYDGAMTLWVMPYVSAMNNIVQRQFEKIVPSEIALDDKGNSRHVDWTWIEAAFVMIEGNVVDAAFNHDKPPLAARAWNAYWSERNGDLEYNWQAFVGVATEDMTNGFWTAYAEAKRIGGLADAPDLQAPPKDADPNASGATKKPKRNS